MERQNRKKRLLIILIGCSLLFIPGVLSFFTSNDDITNPFALGTVDIEITEDFCNPEAWQGNTCKKLVEIQNVGTTEALIRVALVPRWVDTDGTPFPGDTSLITLNYQNIKEATVPAPTGDSNFGWVKGEDGFYYYNTKVISGNKTKALLADVTFDTTKLAPEMLARYEGKTLIVDVQAETVQALQPAYEATWSQMASSNSVVDQMLESLIPQN